MLCTGSCAVQGLRKQPWQPLAQSSSTCRQQVPLTVARRLPGSLRRRQVTERLCQRPRHVCDCDDGLTQTENRVILKARVATPRNFSQFGKV